MSLRQTKDRAAMLLKKYKPKENKSRKASGVEEDHDELMDLLEEWLQLITEMEEDSKEKQKN